MPRRCDITQSPTPPIELLRSIWHGFSRNGYDDVAFVSWGYLMPSTGPDSPVMAELTAPQHGRIWSAPTLGALAMLWWLYATGGLLVRSVVFCGDFDASEAEILHPKSGPPELGGRVPQLGGQAVQLRMFPFRCLRVAAVEKRCEQLVQCSPELTNIQPVGDVIVHASHPFRRCIDSGHRIVAGRQYEETQQFLARGHPPAGVAHRSRTPLDRCRPRGRSRAAGDTRPRSTSVADGPVSDFSSLWRALS